MRNKAGVPILEERKTRGRTRRKQLFAQENSNENTFPREVIPGNKDPGVSITCLNL